MNVSLSCLLSCVYCLICGTYKWLVRMRHCRTGINQTTMLDQIEVYRRVDCTHRQRLKSQGSDRRCTQKGLAAHGCACHLQSDALPLHASRLPVALRRLSYPLSPTDPVLIEETTRRHGSGTSPHLSVRACILKLRLLHRVAAICTRAT